MMCLSVASVYVFSRFSIDFQGGNAMFFFQVAITFSHSGESARGVAYGLDACLRTYFRHFLGSSARTIGIVRSKL